MKSVGLVMASFAAGFLTYFVTLTLPHIYSQDYRVRENGVSWYVFGPSMFPIQNCLDIELTTGNLEDRISIKDPKEIEAIQKWIVDNELNVRLNYSPTWPPSNWDSIVQNYRIDLYSSTDIRDYRNLIISIPLTPIALGVGRKGWLDKVGEIKAIVKTHNL